METKKTGADRRTTTTNLSCAATLQRKNLVLRVIHVFTVTPESKSSTTLTSTEQSSVLQFLWVNVTTESTAPSLTEKAKLRSI